MSKQTPPTNTAPSIPFIGDVTFEEHKRVVCLLDANDPESKAVIYGIPFEAPACAISYELEHWAEDKVQWKKDLILKHGLTEAEAARTKLIFENDPLSLTSGIEADSATLVTWMDFWKMWVNPRWEAYRSQTFRGRYKLVSKSIAVNKTAAKFIHPAQVFSLINSTREPSVEKLR